MTGETTRSTVLLRAAVTVVAVLCAIATVGWLFFGAPVLTSFAPGWAQMSLPSIVCFLLSGASIVALALPMAPLDRQPCCASSRSYGISTDVTDQRRIEAALLASEQRNR